MLKDWPTSTNARLDDVLADRECTVVRTFGERRDSRSIVLGVRCATGERFVVKHAEDPEAIAWLESACRFHAHVQHAAIPAILHRVTTATGVAVVEEWGPGEILSDGYDDAVLPPDHHESAYSRFLRRPVGEVVDAIRQLLDVHVAVAKAGFVAVDLYDGCVLYDFAARVLRLIDLDHYRPGPYVLDVDRQIGSSTYMAPEEFRKGATIDERTMVHALGRMALVYLGCARKSAASREDFRGSDEQFAVATKACAAEPDERIQTVSDLRAGWV